MHDKEILKGSNSQEREKSQTQKGCPRDLLLHIYQKLTIKLETYVWLVG